MKIVEVETELTDSGLQERVEMRDMVCPTMKTVDQGRERGKEVRIREGRG